MQIEVLEGTMTFKLGRKTIVARAGDVVTVPATKARKITNGGFKTAKILIRMPPANDSR
jgi:mannose-6-phosphate isomerase-like protein (cupin superfamily)